MSFYGKILNILSLVISLLSFSPFLNLIIFSCCISQTGFYISSFFHTSPLQWRMLFVSQHLLYHSHLLCPHQLIKIRIPVTNNCVSLEQNLSFYDSECLIGIVSTQLLIQVASSWSVDAENVRGWNFLKKKTNKYKKSQ